MNRTIARLPYHPVVELFPPWTPEEKAKHYEDFDRHGVLVPLLRWQGQLIDGRGRHEWALEHGIELPYFDHDGTEEEAIDAGFSLNYNRRNLTTGQKALAAAGLAKLMHDAGKRRRLANLKNGKNAENSPMGPNEPVGRTSKAVSQKYGISESTVKRGQIVEDHAIPEIKEAVQQDKVTISDAATVSRKPARLQKKATRLFVTGQANSLQQAMRKAQRQVEPKRAGAGTGAGAVACNGKCPRCCKKGKG